MCHLTKPCGSHPCRDSDSRLKFHKRSQLFIGVHNETLTVVAVRVCHEDRAPITIHG
jgi:hypothetical protein